MNRTRTCYLYQLRDAKQIATMFAVSNTGSPIMVKVSVYLESVLLREHIFDKGERVLSIGRHDEHSIPLDDQTVNFDHACLTLGQAITLEDLKSVAGTRLNGAQIRRPTPLNPSDTIEIGKYRLRVVDLRSPAERSDARQDAEKTVELPTGKALQERTGFASYAEYRKFMEDEKK